LSSLLKVLVLLVSTPFFEEEFSTESGFSSTGSDDSESPPSTPRVLPSSTVSLPDSPVTAAIIESREPSISFTVGLSGDSFYREFVERWDNPTSSHSSWFSGFNLSKSAFKNVFAAIWLRRKNPGYELPDDWFDNLIANHYRSSPDDLRYADVLLHFAIEEARDSSLSEEDVAFAISSLGLWRGTAAIALFHTTVDFVVSEWVPDVVPPPDITIPFNVSPVRQQLQHLYDGLLRPSNLDPALRVLREADYLVVPEPLRHHWELRPGTEKLYFLLF